MATEQEVLGKISENNGKAHIQFIARQMGISSDYTRLICTDLVRKGLLEQVPGRDWYQIIKKKARQKPKNNPGKDNPGEEISLGQIIDKGINKGREQIKKAVCLMINKIKVGLKNKN